MKVQTFQSLRKQVLRTWQYLNTERMHIFHSDDDLFDRKCLDPIFNSFSPYVLYLGLHVLTNIFHP